jgi:predicted nucleic acid-binding protein
MCLIIDTCMLSAMLDDSDPMGELVLRWLLKDDGLLAQGGKLTAESNKVKKIQLTLRKLREAGRLFDANMRDPAAFDAALSRYRRLCRSNDAHVLAVAHVSGARTLATNDATLMHDFQNTKLLPHPKGRILCDKTRTEARARLLKHDIGCRKPPSKRAGTRRKSLRLK